MKSPSGSAKKNSKIKVINHNATFKVNINTFLFHTGDLVYLRSGYASPNSPCQVGSRLRNAETSVDSIGANQESWGLSISPSDT